MRRLNGNGHGWMHRAALSAPGQSRGAGWHGVWHGVWHGQGFGCGAEISVKASGRKEQGAGPRRGAPGAQRSPALAGEMVMKKAKKPPPSFLWLQTGDVMQRRLLLPFIFNLPHK